MKSSSTIIISILGGMALGCAATCLTHSKRAKHLKECFNEAFADEIASIHNHIKERHEGLLALIEKNKCRCKNENSDE